MAIAKLLQTICHEKVRIGRVWVTDPGPLRLQNGRPQVEVRENQEASKTLERQPMELERERAAVEEALPKPQTKTTAELDHYLGNSRPGHYDQLVHMHHLPLTSVQALLRLEAQKEGQRDLGEAKEKMCMKSYNFIFLVQIQAQHKH